MFLVVYMTGVTQKRGTRHDTPAAARPVTATGVRRVAHLLLVFLFRLPACELVSLSQKKIPYSSAMFVNCKHYNLWPPQESCCLRGHTQGGTHRRRCTHKAEHTKGGLWPPQESCYLRGHRQGGTHRRRCTHKAEHTKGGCGHRKSHVIEGARLRAFWFAALQLIHPTRVLVRRDG